MDDEELREVEFDNDGLTDTLTQTMAPGLFYQNLKREIATAKRESRELTILSVAINKRLLGLVTYSERELKNLGDLLTTNLREGDFCSRISDHGFWVLLRTGESDVKKIIIRLGLKGRKNVKVNFIARKENEIDQWIDRIDLIHFK